MSYFFIWNYENQIKKSAFDLEVLSYSQKVQPFKIRERPTPG